MRISSIPVLVEASNKHTGPNFSNKPGIDNILKINKRYLKPHVIRFTNSFYRFPQGTYGVFRKEQEAATP